MPLNFSDKELEENNPKNSESPDSEKGQKNR